MPCASCSWPWRSRRWGSGVSVDAWQAWGTTSDQQSMTEEAPSSNQALPTRSGEVVFAANRVPPRLPGVALAESLLRRELCRKLCRVFAAFMITDKVYDKVRDKVNKLAVAAFLIGHF